MRRAVAPVLVAVPRWRLLVYVGEQVHDTDVLDHYRADEIAEIRYYKTTEAATRLRTDNASVIQLVRTRSSRSPAR